ncbi:hypothetical protein HQ447_13975 [bacterium]|nr:hypothetical protein [bacterium]
MTETSKEEMLKLSVLLTVCLLVAPSAFAKERTWTNSRGDSFVGELLSQNDNEVTIRRASDQKEFSVPIQQLTQEDQDYLKQLSKDGDKASEETSYWAGKWEDNNSKFIFKIQKTADGENDYELHNQWIDKQGEVGEETLVGRYTGGFYHIICFNIRLNGDRGVVAARFDGSDPVRFSTANLVRIPSDHEPLLELNLAKYGWKPEKAKFDEQDYRVPLALMNGGTSAYQLREEQNVNLFKNGHFTKRTTSWKGDLEVNPDAPKSENLIAEVEVTRTSKMFSQTIQNQGGQKIEMNFRYRCSLDYDGGGFEVRCVRDDGTYKFFNIPKMNSKWSIMTLSFTDLAGSKSPEIQVRIPRGTRGKIMFDEFSGQLFP